MSYLQISLSFRRQMLSSPLPLYLSGYGTKCLLQILEDVINVLRTYGQADSVGTDSLLCKFCFGELGMGGGSRVNDQGFHISHICQQREKFQVIDKFFCLPGISNMSVDGLCWLYSAVYNATYMLPEAILTTVLVVILIRVAPQIFDPQNARA